MAFAVWGGDPVYPTVNYIQDPNEVIDYRGPDFHEPTPNMLAYLKEVSISQKPGLPSDCKLLSFIIRPADQSTTHIIMIFAENISNSIL